jgi:hypothetical protein
MTLQYFFTSIIHSIRRFLPFFILFAKFPDFVAVRSKLVSYINCTANSIPRSVASWQLTIVHSVQIPFSTLFDSKSFKNV